MAGQVRSARLAQHRQTRRRAVVSVAVPQRTHRRLDHVLGRVRVRLADLEMHDPPALGLESTGAREHLEGSLGAKARDRVGQHDGHRATS